MPPTAYGRFQLGVAVGAALIIGLGILIGSTFTGYVAIGGGDVIALFVVLDLLRRP